ncbi:FAD-binding domain-containing protein [Microthyrium microscopicum]|uniref:FAD-binding domain-containing protein n=1 Tax=Microthyrium microscopicum TaxID=703497 RepID=A0A6A6UI06_9PEZI|nr:FAD-binding domain-containing protein [Microthyrium microscopicum]
MLTRYNHFVLAAFFASISAAPTPSAKQACEAIKKAVPSKLFYPSDKSYTTENTNYYNIGLAELMPACIFQPTTAQEVSTAVKILNSTPDVKFAVKSGGHDPNAGHSSVKDGVLIALSQMQFTRLSSDKKTAEFGPGGHWNDIQRKLDPLGAAVVGGRLGFVGVGGYMMQGGFSFLSGQYGMAADQVQEWEMVLPNATIANIKASDHKLLTEALRGSGDQFGITTKFTTQAYPMGKVWGGIRIFLGSQKDALYEALQDFTANPPNNGKSAVIFTHTQPLGLLNVYALFFFHDGPTPAKGAFGKFDDIKPTIDLCQVRTYLEMSLTLPLVDTKFFMDIQELWTNVTSEFSAKHGSVTATIAFQPFPRTIGKLSVARGGNAMGLTANDEPRFIIEMAYLWGDKSFDADVLKESKTFADRLLSHANELKKKVPKVEKYTPYFMNDAAEDQDVTSSYRNAAQFAKLQQEIDPKGLFRRTGSFQYDMAKIKAVQG